MTRPDLEGLRAVTATASPGTLGETLHAVVAYALEVEAERDAQENMYQMVERLTEQMRDNQNNLDSSARRLEDSNRSLRSMLERVEGPMSSLWLALQNRR